MPSVAARPQHSALPNHRTPKHCPRRRRVSHQTTLRYNTGKTWYYTKFFRYRTKCTSAGPACVKSQYKREFGIIPNAFGTIRFSGVVPDFPVPYRNAVVQYRGFPVLYQITPVPYLASSWTISGNSVACQCDAAGGADARPPALGVHGMTWFCLEATAR